MARRFAPRFPRVSRCPSLLLDRTIAEVAALVGARVEAPEGAVAAVPGSGPVAERRLAALRPLQDAGPDDLAAVFRAWGPARAASTRAGSLLVDGDFARSPGMEAVFLRVPDPADALDRIAKAWGPVPPRPAPGLHPSAVIEPGAHVAPTAAVGALVHVGAGAVVGARSVLRPGVRVGAGAVLGDDCDLGENCVVAHHCVLGDRVSLHPGVVIGAEGFGFRQDERGHHHRIPQVGIVRIADDVEIGSNTTIDRARFDETSVGTGTKIDALCHIGHNVRIGAHCALAGGVMVAGGAVFEDHVFVGGGAAFNNEIRIGRGARVVGFSMVMRGCRPGAVICGQPARELARWKREVAAVGKLPELLARQRGAGPADEGEAP